VEGVRQYEGLREGDDDGGWMVEEGRKEEEKLKKKGGFIEKRRKSIQYGGRFRNIATSCIDSAGGFPFSLVDTLLSDAQMLFL